MANFSDVVAFSRDAQLRQAEREQNDQAFVEDVMTAVREQVEAGGGALSETGEWTRLSENTLQTYRLAFPEGCNVQEVLLAVEVVDVKGLIVFCAGYTLTRLCVMFSFAAIQSSFVL